MPVPPGSTPTPVGARPTTGWPTCAVVSADRARGYRRSMIDRIRSVAAAAPRAVSTAVAAVPRAVSSAAASVPGALSTAAASVPRAAGSLYDRVIDRMLARPHQIATADEARALLE